MSQPIKIHEPIEYPINYDNEALILANAIKDKRNLEIFLRKVDYLKFRVDRYQSIAWSIIEVGNSGLEVNIDAILLKSKSFQKRIEIDYQFLKDIVDGYDVVPEVNFVEHKNQLHTDYIKSILIKNLFSSLYRTCLNPKSTLSDIEKRLDYMKEIVAEGYSISESQFKSLADVAQEYMLYKTSRPSKYTCGFEQIDVYLTEGFAPGQITTIAALSSMGKSSFLLSIMKNLSHLGIPNAQFALEMNNMSLFMKLLAFHTQLPLAKIAKGVESLSDEEHKVFNWEMERLSKNAFMFLNDRPNQTVKTIREQIMILQDKLQTEYIVTAIDLFGKIKDLRRSENFARDYENILNDLQVMVRELQVHMILVAQIRRDVAHRKSKRPTMADIKNSGAFTEVSDIIFGLHRPYYDPELALKYNLEYGVNKSEEDDEMEPIPVDPNQNIAEVILLKQRMGPNNVIINFIFDPVTTCFVPISNAYQQELNKMKFAEFEDEE